jgi:flagellar protein FlgJ
MTNMPSLSAMPAPQSVDSTAATTYTDVNGLASLKRDPNSPEALEGVAKQVEALFLQMMLKSMRDANDSVNGGSSEMSTYQDLFDKQVSLSISQHADLGIARMLKKNMAGKSSAAGGKSLPLGTAPAAPAMASPAPGGAANAGAAPTGAPTGTSAAPPTSNNLGQSAADFVNRLMPSVRRAAGALGLNPEALMAQAALETGWGQRMPRNADGSSSNNLFGIKAGADWAGARASSETMEVVNGVATPRRAAFRAYGSIDESVHDFASLLKSSPRYRDALAAGTDARAYVAQIGKAGYATDPDYANKLNQILDGGTIQSALTARIARL